MQGNSQPKLCSKLMADLGPKLRPRAPFHSGAKEAMSKNCFHRVGEEAKLKKKNKKQNTLMRWIIKIC